MAEQRKEQSTPSRVLYSAGWIIGMNGMLATLINCSETQDETAGLIIGGAFLGILSMVYGMYENIADLKETSQQVARQDMIAGLIIFFSALEILILANNDLTACSLLLGLASSLVYFDKPDKNQPNASNRP